MLIKGAFLDHKEIFIVSFHKILFTGIFFQQSRIGLELIKLMPGNRDLLLVILLAFLQLRQLGPFPKMARNKIPGVKEQDPHDKSNRCQKVFVL